MCSKRCNSNDAISVFEILARELRATLLSNLSSRGLRGLAGSCPAPPDWRPPEGPEGTGGLRGAAPNAVRTPSLAGGRAWLRCPWAAAGPGYAQRRPIGGRREACGAWPGFETRHRAKLGCRGSRAGRPRGGWKSGGVRSKKVVAPRKTWGPPLMRSLT